MLLKIMSYIPLRYTIVNVSLVCKHFNVLVKSGVLWQSFGSLTDFGCISYDKKTLDNIFQHSHHFKRLYFNGNFKKLLSEVSMGYIYQSLSACFNLVVLDLTTNFCISDLSFLAHMPKLRELSIEWCINIEPESATDILSTKTICTQMKKLNMRRCEQFNSSDIILIANAHKNLEELNIFNIDFYSVKYALKIVEMLPRLSTFFLSPDLVADSVQEWANLQDKIPSLVYDFI